MGWIQRAFAPLKRHLPSPVANLIRSSVTAGLAPFLHYYGWGHLRSSFAMRAVDRRGRPLPWYTYPSIAVLSNRTFSGKSVLEFGAGQSTLWWASKGADVVALESDPAWFDEIRHKTSAKMEVHFVPSPDAQTCVANVEKILQSCENRRFDIVVIDGLYRAEVIDCAIRVLSPDGAIICDNADGYGFFEGFRNKGFQRVDFIGGSPGVVTVNVTSIFFKERCFVFDNSVPIAVRA